MSTRLCMQESCSREVFKQKNMFLFVKNMPSQRKIRYLEAYKARCIKQRSDIPIFAKQNIKISFDTDVGFPAAVAT